MNINRNFIIIFGVSVLLIVTILGLEAYYKERESQEPISISEDAINVINPTFDQNYPISSKETDLFQKACANAVTPGKINKGIMAEQEYREGFCIFAKVNDGDDKYIILHGPLGNIPRFQEDQYIGIGVNLYDLLKKDSSPISSEESNFNLCTIIKPTLRDPFREELFKDQINANRNIVLPGGEIYCRKFFGFPPETINLLISGFVPQADLFQAQIYFILEDATVNDLLSQESFTNIEEILQSYPLLWNVEKPVI